MFKKVLRPALIILILLCVALSVEIYDKEFNILAESIDTYSENTYEFTCKICDYPIVDDKGIKVYADVEKSNFPKDIVGSRLLLKLSNDDYDIAKYGYTLKLCGKLTSASPALNKGSFSYRRYLESKNTVAIFDAANSTSIECTDKGIGWANAIYKFRRTVIYNINAHFKGDEAALMTAILTGDRSYISDDMNQAYKNAGIYHIVSVSGLHAGIFISIISFGLVLMPIKSKRKRLITKLAAIIISILLYVFTGFGISITRVILMMTIVFASVVIRREYNMLTAIPCAAALVLIMMPWQIFNQSFLLSFLSTYGLCVALYIFKGTIPENKWGKYLITPFIISLGSTIATLPVSVYNFRMVSVVGLIANIVAVPVSSLLLCAIVGFSLLALILPQSIMVFVRFVPFIPAKMINALSCFVSGWEFSVIRIAPSQFFAASVWVIMLLALGWCIIKNYKTAALITSIIVVVNCSIVMYNKTNENTRVTFINAGKGEATLIETVDNKKILIDCGSKSAENPGEDVFIPYFEHSGIKKVDKLFISYFDDEHTNAINTLMRDGFVDELVLPEETNITREKVLLNKKKIIDAARKFDVKYSYINFGDEVSVGKDVNINLIQGNESLKDKNATAIYNINCSKVSFVLSSCLGAQGQKVYANALGECTVLKIPSYGAMTKNTKDYILSTNPQYAVVTFPAKDKYISFDPDIENTLKDNGISYARTDINKTITFVTDGEKINSIDLREGDLH